MATMGRPVLRGKKRGVQLEDVVVVPVAVTVVVVGAGVNTGGGISGVHWK